MTSRNRANRPMLEYKVDTNAPTTFIEVNGAKVNRRKQNASICLDGTNAISDNLAWIIQLEQGDKLGQLLDRVPYGIINKTITGLGATTLELETQVRNSIIVVPTKSLAYNKHITTERKLGENSSMYIGSPIGHILTEITIEDIRGYLQINNGKRKKFLVVADSLWKVIEAIGEQVYHNYFLMVDEIDTMQSDSVYRYRLESVIDYYFRFDQSMRSAVTATLREFSDSRLMYETYTTTVWAQNPVRNIRLIEANEVDVTAEKIIRDLLAKSSDEKILVAYNSLDGILNLINILSQGGNDTIKEQCGVLCSERNNIKVNDYINDVLDCDNNLQKRIVFMTCAYFAGIDINDKCHVISISSNKQPFTLLSPDRLTQIQGRCRNGVLSETILYDLVPMESNMTYEEFKTQLVRKASKFAKGVNTLYQLCLADADLNEMGAFVKQMITMRAVDKVAQNYPVTIIRENIKKEVVPAYFNIDALLEKWELHYTLYSQSGALRKKLEEQNVVTFEKSDLAKSGRHIGSIVDIKNHNEAVISTILQTAKNRLLEWEQNGADIKELDKLIITSNKTEALFLTRFKQLWPYYGAEFLADVLIASYADRRDFMSLNNSLIFWALDKSHAFKAHVLAKFDCDKLLQGHIKISPSERTLKMKEVMDAYLKGAKLDMTFYSKLFTCFFGDQRIAGDCKIWSLNPYDYPEPKKRITDADGVNLMELFVFPNQSV